MEYIHNLGLNPFKMIEFEDRYHDVCKKVLKKHYNEFRKDIKDGFFYNTPAQGQKRLLMMLGNFRKDMDEVARLNRFDRNLHVIQETIMNEYMVIGRRYGERILKKANLD